jgi:hypothetical protein
MNTIYDGTFVLGSTSATTYQAGNGISITQPSEGVVRISNDETVLWSGAGTSALTLSEPITNFEAIKIYHNAYCEELYGLPVPSEFRFWHMYGNSAQATFKCAMVQTFVPDSTHINIDHTKTLGFSFTATNFTAAVVNNDQYARNIITKVVGINRISGSNT